MVDDCGLGRYHDASTRCSEAKAEIHIVEDNSEVFIETADGIKAFGFHQQACC